MAIRKKRQRIATGKIGKTNTYILNGQLVSREIGFTTNEPTPNQLPVRNRTRLVTALLAPVLPFVRIGFEQVSKGTTSSAYNVATSVNWRNAVVGQYPDQYIDYALASFSKGKIPVLEDVTVEVVNKGLQFTWNPNFILRGMSSVDKVMLLAYCPANSEAYYILDGEKRLKGKDILELDPFVKNIVVHTYVAFISADRKNISNTFYTGKFLW